MSRFLECFSDALDILKGVKVPALPASCLTVMRGDKGEGLSQPDLSNRVLLMRFTSLSSSLIHVSAVTRFRRSLEFPSMISALVLMCRKAVEEKDGGPGSAGRRETLSLPDGAVEALSGQALLPLEIRQLV